MATDKRIHTGRWTALSRKILLRDNYECAVDGCDTVATTTDHILPSSKYPELFWNEDNLQAMCAAHNFGKQATLPGKKRNIWFNTNWFSSEYIQDFKANRKEKA